MTNKVVDESAQASAQAQQQPPEWNPGLPRKVRARELEDVAFELRKGGASYGDIAKILTARGTKISKAGAHKAVARVLAALREHTKELAVDVREMELQRLDSVFMKIFSQAKAGNQGAVDRVLRIMERRAKLLGLDAPDIQLPYVPREALPEWIREELPKSEQQSEQVEA